jgi:hypothetical protein
MRYGIWLAVSFLIVGLAGGAWFGSQWWRTEPTAQPQHQVTKVVVPEERISLPAEALPEVHPLDPALQLARKCLDYIQAEVNDYECTLVKHERVGKQLTEPQEMFARIRNRKVKDDEIVTPLSVYLNFTKPDSVKGQKVLWVEGQNNGKMLARAGGTLGALTPSIWLDPTGPIAMRGSRYSIEKIGIENLVVELIEKGERDRKYEDCEVEIVDEKFDDRNCTRIEVRHPQPREYFDFHIARIHVDSELKVPIHYAAYTWPEADGKEPQLLEEYSYRDLKLNVGLTDADFDSTNPDYGF